MNVNECELMIHRRTFVDDRYGVGEALDEQAFGLPLVARGKHLIFLGNQEEGYFLNIPTNNHHLIMFNRLLLFIITNYYRDRTLRLRNIIFRGVDNNCLLVDSTQA